MSVGGRTREQNSADETNSQVGWLMRAQKYLDGSGRFLGAGFSNDCNGFLH